MIEQPLAHDDIIDHARLQAALKTPICLDESIHSADDARKALDLGACRIINIKVSRAGWPARGQARARPLPGARRAGLVRRDARVRHRPGGQRRDRLACPDSPFPATSRARTSTTPRTSSSRRSWPIDGAIAVFDGPGLGVEPVEERIRARTLRELSTHGVKEHVRLRRRTRELLRCHASTRSLDLLAELVRLESPSRDKPALDALASAAGGPLALHLGAAVEIVPNAQGGDHVLGSISGHQGELRPALVLGHFDTVWPRGTLERMPFRVDETAGHSGLASST